MHRRFYRARRSRVGICATILLSSAISSAWWRTCSRSSDASLAAAAERLAGDLYEHRAHFVHELVQNADDAKYASDAELELGLAGLELRPLAARAALQQRSPPMQLRRRPVQLRQEYLRLFTEWCSIHSGDQEVL